MASDRLDECAQVWPRDSKDKRPVVLRVQVTICQDEEALVRLWSELVTHDHVEQILCVELLAFRVKTHSSLDQFVDFQVLEVQLNRWLGIS